MDKKMVAPFQLHRSLEQARNAGAKERQAVLGQVLDSGILAVIRRIPDTMFPLSDEEKEMVAKWADGQASGTDVSDRDFAFHLMTNCQVPAERILGILEQNKTFSRSVLDHIQQVLGGEQSTERLKRYLQGVAETLLGNTEVRPRDRGRHMLMTLAQTEEDWQNLASRFSIKEISDLRQRVIERFLAECPDGDGLNLFVDNVVGFCMEKIKIVNDRDSMHKEAPRMHWVLSCFERIKARDRFSEAARSFLVKFGRFLPRSLRWRIDSVVPYEVQGELLALIKPVQPIVVPVIQPVLSSSFRRPILAPVEKATLEVAWRPKVGGPVPVIGAKKPSSANPEKKERKARRLPVIAGAPPHTNSK